MSSKGDDDSEDAAPVIIIGRHKTTNRYATFDTSHLDHSNPEVQNKLSYLSGEDD